MITTKPKVFGVAYREAGTGRVNLTVPPILRLASMHTGSLRLIQLAELIAPFWAAQVFVASAAT
jgi:hypothetical protein